LSRLAKSYAVVYPAIARLRGGFGLVQGLALGLMRVPDFHALDQTNVDHSEKWGGLEHNLRGLHSWEREALDRYFGGVVRIAITSVGGGREAIALEQAGYEVEACECNPVLVDCANRNLEKLGLRSRVEWVERDEAPRLVRTAEAVIVGWGAYTLISGRDRRIAYLNALASQMREGAPLLISYALRQPGRGGKLDERINRIASTIRRLTDRDPLETGDTLDGNVRHRFTEAEVHNELKQAGFDGVHFGTEGFPHAVGLRKCSL